MTNQRRTARVLPFRGVLYNTLKVNGDDVVAPPYDIISPDFKETLYRRSPFNVVRVDFGKDLPDDGPGTSRYTRAKAYLEGWLRDSVLAEDELHCFYACEIGYTLQGRAMTLRGLIGLVRIDELGNGVYPHEATHSKPKADRLDLMRSCFGNISPIYSLYHSPERVTSRVIESPDGVPCFTARDAEGAVHRLYRITRQDDIEAIQRELADRPVYIADGHHRYEVALEFKREMDAKAGAESSGETRPWDYVMMFLANTADRGISILPTHRLFKGLPGGSDALSRLRGDFAITEQPLGTDIAGTLAAGGRSTFGLYLDNGERWHLLSYRGDKLDGVPAALRDLDVVVLHELIIRRDLGLNEVSYEMDVREALRSVRSGAFDGALFLNPTQVADVERVALANLRMPPKSTYFYPKLLTGLVINSFNNF